MFKTNDIVNVQFNGKDYNLRIDSETGIDVDISECLKALDSDELFNYLYRYHIHMFNEINSDPYYEGKTVKSGKDLKESIKKIKIIACKKGVVYICGEYWCDPEHGFSIKFPGGKFVKSKYDVFDFDRDEGKDASYIPKCTVLGHFSDYL